MLLAQVLSEYPTKVTRTCQRCECGYAGGFGAVEKTNNYNFAACSASMDVHFVTALRSISPSKFPRSGD